MFCWFLLMKFNLNGKYILCYMICEVKCVIKVVCYKVNINMFYKLEGDVEIGMNDIGCVFICIVLLLFFDVYKCNCNIGSLIFVDEYINVMVGVGMIF